MSVEPGPGRRILIVTPCRDEAEFLEAAIASLAAQSLPPARWVVVDDGSSDATPAILARAAARLPFLEVTPRADRGERKVGAGVIEAFYDGLEGEDLEDYDYVCKLDADLELPPRYFERLVEEMEADPHLGTISGKCYLRDDSGALHHERRGDENSVGPSKFYRVACFRDIGGFARAAGWDGIDGHVCRQRGWVARSIDEPELRLVHLRRMGSSDRSVLVGRLRGGAGKWFIGSSLPYVAATTVYRLIDPPPVIGAIFMLVGYLRAMIARAPRYGDAAYRRALRRWEWRALFFGKGRATEEIHDRIRATVAR